MHTPFEKLKPRTFVVTSLREKRSTDLGQIERVRARFTRSLDTLFFNTNDLRKGTVTTLLHWTPTIASQSPRRRVSTAAAPRRLARYDRSRSVSLRVEYGLECRPSRQNPDFLRIASARSYARPGLCPSAATKIELPFPRAMPRLDSFDGLIRRRGIFRMKNFFGSARDSNIRPR